MPKRPHSHRVADQAVNRVESIFVNCGWAWDRIQHDYGEDLLVQTVLNDEVALTTEEGTSLYLSDFATSQELAAFPTAAGAQRMCE